MSREQDGLIARIKLMRRALTTPDVITQLQPTSVGDADSDQLQALQVRVAHLEQLVQGLQDSVYRESHRQEKRVTDLEAQVDPASLASALSKHTREHGL